MAKLAAIFTALAVALLAFLVFFSGNGENTAEGGQEVFLPQGRWMAINAESIEDTTAFIGEDFILRFTIQYRADKIEPNMDSLATVPLSPFEVAGSAKVVKREVTENISEYVYEISLRRITTIPGKPYTLNPILLEYENVSTGVKDTVDIAPKHAFQTGSYYGRDLEGVSLRPSVGTIKSDHIAKSFVLLGLAFISFLMLVSMLFKRDHSTEEDASPEFKDEAAEAVYELERFSDEEWVREKSPKERLKEITKPALKLARVVHGISPHMFWKNKDDEDWEALTSSLSSAYKKELEDYDDIFTARNAIRKIFSSTIKEKTRKPGAHKRSMTKGR